MTDEIPEFSPEFYKFLARLLQSVQIESMELNQQESAFVDSMIATYLKGERKDDAA